MMAVSSKPSTALLLALLGLACIAQTHAMCPKSWNSFSIREVDIQGKSTSAEHARDVLQSTAEFVAKDLVAKGVVGKKCPYTGSIEAEKSCMKSVITKNVVRYGMYDNLFKIAFNCEDDEKVYEVYARSKVGRKGQFVANPKYTYETAEW